MEEKAKEELRILEAQYPNRYEYLKLELKSLIFLLQSHQTTTCITTTATTQESTSRRKRKKSSTEYHCSRYLGDTKAEDQTQQFNGQNQMMCKTSDRVEVVLERAQTCLRKIKHLKASLLSCSPAES